MPLTIPNTLFAMMKLHPQFSVFAVCFNAKQTIKATLNSIARQICDDDEVIIVDGSSADGTLDILHSYSYSECPGLDLRSSIVPTMICTEPGRKADAILKPAWSIRYTGGE